MTVGLPLPVAVLVAEEARCSGWLVVEEEEDTAVARFLVSIEMVPLTVFFVASPAAGVLSLSAGVEPPTACLTFVAGGGDLLRTGFEGLGLVVILMPASIDVSGSVIRFVSAKPVPVLAEDLRDEMADGRRVAGGSLDAEVSAVTAFLVSAADGPVDFLISVDSPTSVDFFLSTANRPLTDCFAGVVAVDGLEAGPAAEAGVTRAVEFEEVTAGLRTVIEAVDVRDAFDGRLVVVDAVVVVVEDARLETDGRAVVAAADGLAVTGLFWL